MYFRFSTLTLIAAVVMSAVSATKGDVDVKGVVSGDNIVADQARAGLVTAAKRSYLSRRRVANELQRRRDKCNHKNHKTYQLSDEGRHYRPHHYRNHCGGDSYCGDSDSDEYEHEHEHDFEFDEDDFEVDEDDDYYECDECDACDDEDYYGYMSYEDYEDETT